MRILFGVLGLLIVASIVLSVARKQLQAVSQLPKTAVSVEGAPVQVPAPSGERAGRLDAFPGAVAADPGSMTVPQQSQAIQNKVANDVKQIMQNAPSRGEGQ